VCGVGGGGGGWVGREKRRGKKKEGNLEIRPIALLRSVRSSSASGAGRRAHFAKALTFSCWPRADLLKMDDRHVALLGGRLSRSKRRRKLPSLFDVQSTPPPSPSLAKLGELASLLLIVGRAQRRAVCRATSAG